MLGAVQLGGLAAGQANTITAGQTGILLLAGGVMGTVTAQDNTISAVGAGIDFEQGENDFTATGNDIAAGASAGIVVNQATSGIITIGTAADGNSIAVTGPSTNGISISHLAAAASVFVVGNTLRPPMPPTCRSARPPAM